jgi:hypothetical protein
MLLPRARQPEFRLPCRGSAGIPCLSVCGGKEGCPVRRRSRTKSTSRALPAGSRDRLRTRSPGTPPDGPGGGSAPGPAACMPSRSPARPGIFRQATELTKPQCDLFTALAIDPPKRIQELAATRWPARVRQQPPTALTGGRRRVKRRHAPVLGNHAFPQVRSRIRGLASTLNDGTQVKAYLWKRRDQQQPPVPPGTG